MKELKSMVFRIHFFPSFKIRISFICKSFLKCLNFLYFGCTVSSLWHTGLSVAVCRLFLEVRWLLIVVASLIAEHRL